MIEYSKINVENIIPGDESVLLYQGIPKGTIIKDHIRDLLDTSRKLFLNDAKPVYMTMEISKRDFEVIYFGEGNNEKESPIEEIFKYADDLFLYAATLGEQISDRIRELFEVKDFAVASMLDAFASAAVDNAVELLEQSILEELNVGGRKNGRKLVFGYSPGYCGWNIESQQKLFEYLHPENIGITLNESCLMTPIKSVSGVLIHGDKTIHDFKNSFSFCAYCKTESCLERIEKIYKH